MQKPTDSLPLCSTRCEIPCRSFPQEVEEKVLVVRRELEWLRGTQARKLVFVVRQCHVFLGEST